MLEAIDWEECKPHRKFVADEALRILISSNIQENPELYCTSQTGRIPIRFRNDAITFLIIRL